MNTIQAKNVITELDVAGTFYPVFCCKNMEYNQSQEPIEVTTVNSAFSREYVPGMTSATLEVDGITILDNTGSRISITYLMQESVRRAVQSMRIRLTDDDGGTLAISFNAIITNNNLSRAFGSYSVSSSSFVITGNPSISTVIPPPGPGIDIEAPLYIDVVAGQSSVTDAGLIGATILEVARSGLTHSLVTGTPGSLEFAFDGTTGTVSFDPTNPFNTGEVIYILFML